MLKEAFGTGQTVEEAKEDAVAKLGIPADGDYEFEIIDLPHKKTFGLFGGSAAKVRVFIDDGAAEPQRDIAKSDRPHSHAGRREREDRPAEKISAGSAEDMQPVPDDDKTLVYARNILEKMGIENFAAEGRQSEGLMTIEISGDNIGTAIGRRGETLDAIQYLCSIIANQGSDKFTRIVVDTGDYREKRAEALKKLAANMAAKARRTGRNQMLEPMNPYERRIIHTAVQDIDGISSWSVGEGIGRRVVIGRRRGEGGSRPRSGGRPYRQGGSRTPADSTPHESKDDLGSAPLYGRIDKRQ